MDFSQVAAGMWPLWLLGLFMAFSAWKTDNKDLLRVENKPLLKWCAFLVFLTVYRLLIFHFLKDQPMVQTATEAAQTIPWQMTLLVFWEDLSFALPLVYLDKLIGTKKWLRPLYWLGMLVMMLSFGSGHIYQGLIPALALSFYVPFSISRGKMYGFGTVVLCHMLYDMSTLLAVRLALGI
jgi:hypothetical protein